MYYIYSVESGGRKHMAYLILFMVEKTRTNNLFPVFSGEWMFMNTRVFQNEGRDSFLHQ